MNRRSHLRQKFVKQKLLKMVDLLVMVAETFLENFSCNENFKFLDFLLLFFQFFATMPTLAMRHGKSIKTVVANCDYSLTF